MKKAAPKKTPVKGAAKTAAKPRRRKTDTELLQAAVDRSLARIGFTKAPNGTIAFHGVAREYIDTEIMRSVENRFPRLRLPPEGAQELADAIYARVDSRLHEEVRYQTRDGGNPQRKADQPVGEGICQVSSSCHGVWSSLLGDIVQRGGEFPP